MPPPPHGLVELEGVDPLVDPPGGLLHEEVEVHHFPLQADPGSS